MSVSAKANDGHSHSVQVYTDITGEWVTGDNSLVANWETSTSDNVVIHQAQLANTSVFSEANDHVQCALPSRALHAEQSLTVFH